MSMEIGVQRERKTVPGLLGDIFSPGYRTLDDGGQPQYRSFPIDMTGIGPGAEYPRTSAYVTTYTKPDQLLSSRRGTSLVVKAADLHWDRMDESRTVLEAILDYDELPEETEEYLVEMARKSQTIASAAILVVQNPQDQIIAQAMEGFRSY